ncbi:TIGR00269 family protein [Candidatus Woesearchaeota archaeon]|nr:TIGR00269 family protein [Candidatus Woesearchaeota archaeon]
MEPNFIIGQAILSAESACSPVQNESLSGSSAPSSLDPAAFEQRIQQTITEHSLFTKEDLVLVACSGGKDSTVLLYVLKKLGYTVEAITIDAAIGCYTKENLKNLHALCSSLHVKLHVVEFKKEFGKSLCYIQSVLKENGYHYKSCHTCGVLRRYLINRESKAIKPAVVATGHNLDDEAQAVLMSFLRGSLPLISRTGPKTNSGGDPRFIPRVKPLYFTPEKEVVAYSRLKQFPVHYGACPCSSDSYRREVRTLFRDFLSFPADPEEVKNNIVASFLTMKPALMGHFSMMSGSPIRECPICGEPASQNICNACAILAKVAPSDDSLPPFSDSLPDSLSDSPSDSPPAPEMVQQADAAMAEVVIHD